jgi:hypothetical protein
MKNMNKYIKDGQFIEFSFELDEKYNVGSSYEDYQNGKFVKLSDEQISFMESNPTASISEVWNMKMNVVERTLEQAKQEKLAAIEQYDSSDSVNSFSVNGKSAWLTPEVRGNYKTSIDAAELLGETSITFAIAGQAVTVPLQNAKILLAKIQRYADACFLVTQQHKIAVNSLTTIEAVENFDYKTGYPEKLKF